MSREPTKLTAAAAGNGLERQRGSYRSLADDPQLERAQRVVEPRYRIECFLNSGGTSHLYLARDRVQQRRVVIKVLDESAVQNPVLRGRFLAGYRAARQILHPNVIQVFDVAEEPVSVPYAVMERLSGEPLNDLLSREVALKPDFALRVAWQVSAGLERIHAERIIHCDIKPENLFVCDTEGVPGRVKILDMGLAVVEGCEILGEAHIVQGTAQYMAPEQVVGDPVDARTDLYALGVVLFRMLTGHLPFDLKLSATLLRHQLGSPVPPPSWLNEELEPGIDQLVLRALQKHPDNRQGSLAEFQGEIENALLGRLESIPALAPRVRPDSYMPRSERGSVAAALLGC